MLGHKFFSSANYFLEERKSLTLESLSKTMLCSISVLSNGLTRMTSLIASLGDLQKLCGKIRKGEWGDKT